MKIGTAINLRGEHIMVQAEDCEKYHVAVQGINQLQSTMVMKTTSRVKSAGWSTQHGIKVLTAVIQ